MSALRNVWQITYKLCLSSFAPNAQRNRYANPNDGYGREQKELVLAPYEMTAAKVIDEWENDERVLIAIELVGGVGVEIK